MHTPRHVIGASSARRPLPSETAVKELMMESPELPVLVPQERVTDFVARFDGATIDRHKLRINPLAAASPVVGMWVERNPEECPERVRAALRAQAQTFAELTRTRSAGGRT